MIILLLLLKPPLLVKVGDIGTDCEGQNRQKDDDDPSEIRRDPGCEVVKIAKSNRACCRQGVDDIAQSASKSTDDHEGPYCR